MPRRTSADYLYRFGRIISDYDLHLFGEGLLLRRARAAGRASDLARRRGGRALRGVGAERPARVSDRGLQPVGRPRAPDAPAGASGIWELFIPDLGDGAHYKFEIRTGGGHLLHKTDPYGRYFEVPPRSASIVCRTEGYEWGDKSWMASRGDSGASFTRPMSIYEVHLASWRREPEDDIAR